MFNILIYVDLPVGVIGKISEVTCPSKRCNFVSDVIIGVTDESDLKDEMEVEMRNKINKI